MKNRNVNIARPMSKAKKEVVLFVECPYTNNAELLAVKLHDKQTDVFNYGDDVRVLLQFKQLEDAINIFSDYKVTYLGEL